MTQVELMENLAAFLKNVVREYESQQSDGSYTPITVYSGYLPVKTNAKESEHVCTCWFLSAKMARSRVRLRSKSGSVLSMAILPKDGAAC